MVDRSEYISRLYRDNYDDMLTFAASALRNPDLAQDAVQDAFLIAQIKIDVLISSPNPRGWLFNTLKNVIGNMFQQQKRIFAMLAPIDSGDHGVEMELSLSLEYKGCIPENDLQMLFWIYCEGECYQKVADRLNIGLSTCKKRIQRAKARLKEALE